MNKQQILKRYSNLLNDVASKDFYKVDLTSRVNCYVCTVCHRITKTKDVDAGVTPFIHTCEHCGKDAHSTFYKDIAPHLQPTQEWYRPTLEQVLKMKSGMLDHVLQGGLDVRKISKP